MFALQIGRTFSQAMEVLWKMRTLVGGRDACIPPFKMPTLNTETLHPKDTMRDGYCLKMLLYVIDELFYIYSQVKNLRRVDEKVVLAYEILCLSTNRCTDWQNGIEKTGMPDALALLKMNDAHHLKHLVWAVYDGALLVVPWPKLQGNCPWCTVLGGATDAYLQGP